jgi:predicted nucleic acid-binding protein
VAGWQDPIGRFAGNPDPDDDKFLACAVASGSNCVISGDKLLLNASGFHGIEVIKPRQFVDRYLPAMPEADG